MRPSAGSGVGWPINTVPDDPPAVDARPRRKTAEPGSGAVAPKPMRIAVNQLEEYNRLASKGADRLPERSRS